MLTNCSKFLKINMLNMPLFSCSVMSDSATPWTAASQASLSFTVSQIHSNSCPLSQRCHPTISSSVVPFSYCLQSFPASGSFPVSWVFVQGGQSIGASASASVLPMNIQGWFLLRLIVLISLLSKGLSRVFSSTRIQKIKRLFLPCSAFFMAQLSHLYITGKTIALKKWSWWIHVLSSFAVISRG